MTLRTISFPVLQEYHQQKRHHSDLPTLDLSECDLRHFDLRDLDLSAANLSHADLTGALLDKTNLRNTTLYKTRFADIPLGALLAAGIGPVDLLQQHRGATYYLLRLFHFAPLPEHERMFELTNEECARICQFHANLLWQDLDNQAVISALYPGGIWEDGLLDILPFRPVFNWIMTHPEVLPTLSGILTGKQDGLLATKLRNARQIQDIEELLTTAQKFAANWERDQQRKRQRAEEEAVWFATSVTYPPAPWADGPQVTQIKSRQELIAVLQAGAHYEVSSHQVIQFECDCLNETYFLYHVEEPGSKRWLVTVLQDGSVWWMKNAYQKKEPEISEPGRKPLPDGSIEKTTNQEQAFAPLLVWIQSWGSPQNDLSPLGRACYLLSRAGIVKLIYQIYWYCDEDQVDVQSCLDEQGNELASDNPAIWRAHWVLYYEDRGRDYYGRYELSVPEKRLVRLGDAQIPELEEDNEFFEEAEE